MIKRLHKLPCYFLSLLFTLTLLVFLICLLPKANGFLLLNQYHSQWLDLFFKVVTNLGDGLFFILVIVILLALKKKKKAIALLFAYAYSGVLVQLLKRIYNAPRPRLFLEQLNIHFTHYVEGLSLHDHYSFPSGHTASAFATATILVMVFKKYNISIPCLIFAIAVGYSRIYLAQHFPIDVLVGALTGIICALLSYYHVYQLKLFRKAKAAKRLKRLRISRINTLAAD